MRNENRDLKVSTETKRTLRVCAVGRRALLHCLGILTQHPGLSSSKYQRQAKVVVELAKWVELRFCRIFFFLMTTHDLLT